MQRALAMTFPASPKRASERCFSSAMEAKSLTGFRPDAGSGVAAETASPTPTIAIAPAKLSLPCAYAPPQALAAERENGSVNTCWPVSFDQALAIAGAIGGVPGSPMPVGFSLEGTICTSMSGISLMRSTR